MKPRFLVGTLLSIVAAVVGLTVVFGSFYTIDQGERGVLLRNGAVTGIAEPGLGFKMPIIDDVKEITTQSQTRIYQGIEAYSFDQQTAVISFSVSYSLLPSEVDTIYSTYGGHQGIIDRLLDRRALEQLKNVFGQFSAVRAIQERSRLNAEVSEAIQSAVRGPLVIESVQIEDVAFSDVYENSIEQRMLAEVEVQKLEQNLERERVQADITVTQATATANAVRQAAMAEAEAIRLKGDAEADAINARGEALSQNPLVVQLITAERWNGTLPATMPPNGTVPFIDLN